MKKAIIATLWIILGVIILLFILAIVTYYSISN